MSSQIDEPEGVVNSRKPWKRISYPTKTVSTVFTEARLTLGI